jgi:hypothetical protein
MASKPAVRTGGCLDREMTGMLKSIGSAALSLRWGSRICVCMRRTDLDDGLIARIRPLIFGGYAFWCDRPDP